jgi:hypothetical protein
MSYYNLCGIGSQYSNISKEKKGGCTYKKITGMQDSYSQEGEVTYLSGSSQGGVGDNREKWGYFWEKLIVINQNIVSRSL